MKRVLIFFLRLLVFWLWFFACARVLFFVMNFSSIETPNATSILQPFYYGLKLDFSISGYVMLVSGLMVSLGHLFRSPKLGVQTVRIFNKFVLIVFALFLVVNARLYTYWGHHVDASILDYLKTPKEALASANWRDWFVTLVVSLGFIWAMFQMYRIAFFYKWKNIDFKRRLSVPTLVLTAILIVPIRGGFDVASLNVSSAYFSEDNFQNHTALNPVWNALYSLSEQTDDGELVFMDPTVADSIHSEVFDNGLFENDELTLNNKTNVVFIILESFTSNVVGALGGINDVTPNLDKWVSKGLSFSNFYSSGDRSDRGLTTLFTGFPSLPNGRLLKYPNKLANAPSLYRNFKDQGYYTSFYYGGNLEFANLKLLFTEGRVKNVVSKKNLSGDLTTGKWGVRDGDMFNVFWEDITEQKQPFFSTLYTLSSHEPFDIPTVSFKLNQDDSKFYEAIYYTDSCFGQFMNDLEKSDLWDNTLVVVTADHGVRKPDDVVLYSPRKYRVPLVLTGGVVEKAKMYTHYASHTDLPFSLEEILFGLQNQEYAYSKSVFDTSKSFAHYYYNLGAGMVNEQGCVVYDIMGEYFLVNTTSNDSAYRKMQQELLGITQSASAQFKKF